MAILRIFFGFLSFFILVYKNFIILRPILKLSYGVMVAQQILVLFVLVRIQVGQQNKKLNPL